MSLPDPEVINRVARWRSMEISGEMTDEERIKAVLWLREKRRAAETASQTAKGTTKRSSKPSKSADELLGELGI